MIVFMVSTVQYKSITEIIVVHSLDMTTVD